jgi:benzaldehyde dehydrogenase (NAD)
MELSTDRILATRVGSLPRPQDASTCCSPRTGGTEFGLTAGVISSSVSRAQALGNRLKTGMLHINDQTVGDEPQVPFGGRGASGNGMRVGGPANWEAFTQWQWVTVQDAVAPYPF